MVFLHLFLMGRWDANYVLWEPCSEINAEKNTRVFDIPTLWGVWGFFNKLQGLLYIFQHAWPRTQTFYSMFCVCRRLALPSRPGWPWSSSSSDGQINLLGDWEQRSWLSYSTPFYSAISSVKNSPPLQWQTRETIFLLKKSLNIKKNQTKIKEGRNATG